MVNLAQILTIDKGRLIKKLGHVGDDKMKEIDEAIKVSLGI
jgi:mRNA interferase MazF